MRLPLDKMNVQNVKSLVTSGFATPERPNHLANDFAGGGIVVGDAVRTIKGGYVATAKFDPAAGNFVRVDHGGGLHTRYLHLNSLSVRAGQWVEEGQQIGTFGNTGQSTGPHLHFELVEGVRKVGTQYYGTPRDCIPYFLGQIPLPTLYIDGQMSTLASYIEGGRMYVALEMKNGFGWCWIRHMANAFRYDIVWVQQTLTAYLTKERGVAHAGVPTRTDRSTIERYIHLADWTTGDGDTLAEEEVEYPTEGSH